MKSIAFSEHGNIYNWTKKKIETEKRGLKYIHAQEFYITETLEEKIRDNYHTNLIARNWDGVKELNTLSSIAYNKEDNHFYYNPRISIDELINTSDNIIVTSACLASPLWKGRNENIYNKYLQFFINNKYRCFLEIQYHNIEQQKQHNLNLYNLHKQYSIPLITGTDTHALNKDYLEARKILLQAKGMEFTDEESFDLTFKSYYELVKMFKKQNVLPEDIYLEAIENTNKMADMIEEFELDYSFKYPKLINNPEKVFKQKINEGIKQRGIDKLNKEKKKIYFNRIKKEYDVYKNNGMIDYMLLMEDIIQYAKINNIMPGYSRGSVSGSLIAYCLGITEMDSVKHGLIFERFAGKERVSLGDIDTDFPPSQRQKVIEYVANKKEISFSEIVTFNTIAIKGSIREVGRALKIPLNEVDKIAKHYEEDEQKYRKQYPELFKYVDILNGTNISVGSHPAGFVVSPYSIIDHIGYFYTSTSKYPVCQINMRELDSLNYVKLDLLGLDNIEIINETCRLANIERLTPDNTPPEDDKTWEEIKESPLGIFQMEGKFAHDILVKTLNNIDKMRKYNPDIKRIDIMSMVNGALRPSGESYRNDFCNGVFKDNGHKALNEFLKSRLGYLIYQEDIALFLTKFCGFTLGEADLVRKKIGKKLGTEDLIPKIKQEFIKTMHEEYNVPNEKLEEIVEPFLQVILSASSYGFSLNHSLAYTWISYICSYLRCHYPLEFITTLLNVNEDNIDKTAEIYRYANSRNIKILSIQFRKSHAKYNMDKKNNSIFKGIQSIKHLNSKIAEELYQLGKNTYNSFLDLLIDIDTKTSVNTKQLSILIKLNFFKEFGNNHKLLAYTKLFNKFYNKKQFNKQKLAEEYNEKFINLIKRFSNETEKMYTKFQSIEFLTYIWDKIPNKKLAIISQIKAEKEYLGYISTKIPNINKAYNIVLETNTKYTPRILVYNLNTGEEQIYKIYKSKWKEDGKQLKENDIIFIKKTFERPKVRKVEDKWEETGEFEMYIADYFKVIPKKLNKLLEKQQQNKNKNGGK